MYPNYRFSQNRSSMPKNIPSESAVSEVMRRRPFTISQTGFG